MTTTKQSVTRSLSVTDWLRENILSGSLGPGERLQEVRLSEQLGVSRTPVRAALHSLAAAGLVDYAPNRGYAVRDFPIPEMIDAYEIRGALEGLAARFAAERGLTHDQESALEEALTKGDKALAAFETLGPEFMTQFRDVNVVFHDTVLDAARNRMLAEMIRISYEKPRVSNRVIVTLDIRELERRHDEHHRIYEAIMARDPARAENIMREHVAGVKLAMVRSLRKPAGSQVPADTA
jgi:GntR family transcriptional regulator of vanillate catabolism